MRILWSIVAGVLAVGIFSVGRAAEHDEKHVFAVQPGCTLRIDTYRGEITVTESDASEVQVSIHMEIGGDTDEAAQQVLRGLQLEVKEAGNVVSILARNPRETRARWVWREDEQIGLFYRITVPRQCNVEIKNSKGEVTIGRLQGRMVAEVKTGSAFFRGVEGSLQVEVGEGDLVISRCTGEVKARVRSGSIRTGLIGGAAELRNDNGGIEVMVARRAIKAEATAGDVTVGFGRDLPEPASIRSSGGNVFARLDPESRCELRATSRWGSVTSDVPVAAENDRKGKRRLQGRVNGGGALVTLHADGGNVRIEAGRAPFE